MTSMNRSYFQIFCIFKVAAEKLQQQQEKKGWFSGWFGNSKTDKKGTTKTTIAGTSSGTG